MKVKIYESIYFWTQCVEIGHSVLQMLDTVFDCSVGSAQSMLDAEELKRRGCLPSRFLSVMFC